MEKLFELRLLQENIFLVVMLAGVGLIGLVYVQGYIISHIIRFVDKIVAKKREGDNSLNENEEEDETTY